MKSNIVFLDDENFLNNKTIINNLKNDIWNNYNISYIKKIKTIYKNKLMNHWCINIHCDYIEMKNQIVARYPMSLDLKTRNKLTNHNNLIDLNLIDFFQIYKINISEDIFSYLEDHSGDAVYEDLYLYLFFDYLERQYEKINAYNLKIKITNSFNIPMVIDLINKYDDRSIVLLISKYIYISLEEIKKYLFRRFNLKLDLFFLFDKDKANEFNENLKHNLDKIKELEKDENNIKHLCDNYENLYELLKVYNANIELNYSLKEEEIDNFLFDYVKTKDRYISYNDLLILFIVILDILEDKYSALNYRSFIASIQQILLDELNKFTNKTNINENYLKNINDNCKKQQLKPLLEKIFQLLEKFIDNKSFYFFRETILQLITNIESREKIDKRDYLEKKNIVLNNDNQYWYVFFYIEQLILIYYNIK